MKEPKLPIEPESFRYNESAVKIFDLKYDSLSVKDLQKMIDLVKENPTRRIVTYVDHEKSYYDESCNYWAQIKVVEFNQKKYDEDVAKYEKDLVEYPVLMEQYKTYLKEKQENDEILKTKRKYEEYLRLKKEFEFIEKATI